MSVMEERRTLSSKELKRLKVLAMIQHEQVTVARATCGVCPGWARAAITKVESNGATGLISSTPEPQGETTMDKALL
jgi:hypothetical protein